MLKFKEKIKFELLVIYDNNEGLSFGKGTKKLLFILIKYAIFQKTTLFKDFGSFAVLQKCTKMIWESKFPYFQKQSLEDTS